MNRNSAGSWSGARKRSALFAAGLLVTGGAGLVALEHSTRRAPSEPIAPAAAGSATAPQRLSDTNGSARRAAPPSDSALPASDAPAPKAERADRFRGGAPTLEARLRRAQEHDELSRRLAAEHPNPAWSESIERRMQALLGENAVSSRALELVDCRETICRLHLRTEDDGQQAIMAVIRAALLLHQETWLLPEEDGDGSRFAVDVFLPAQGHRLSAGGGRIGSEVAAVEAPPIGDAPERQAP